MILFIGGYFMYLKYGLLEYLPCYFLSSIHLYTGSLLAIFCLTSFYLACKTKPGEIDNRNIDYYLKKYKYDNVLFIENTKCSTCKIKK